jgi:hypothetical protein
MEAGVIRRYDVVKIIEGVVRGQRIEVRVGGDNRRRSLSVKGIQV